MLVACRSSRVEELPLRLAELVLEGAGRVGARSLSTGSSGEDALEAGRANARNLPIGSSRVIGRVAERVHWPSGRVGPCANEVLSLNLAKYENGPAKKRGSPRGRLGRTLLDEGLMIPMPSERVPMKYLPLIWLSIRATLQRRRGILVAERVVRHSDEGLMSPMPSELVTMKYLPLIWLSLRVTRQRREGLLVAERVGRHSDEGLMSPMPSERVPIKYLS